MKALITGGAGFIGSHLAEVILERGDAVVVLDSFDPFYDVEIKLRNVELCRAVGGDRYTFVEGSTTDESTLADVFEAHDIDIVYHEASRAGVRQSVDQPASYERNNVIGLLNVLDMAAASDVRRFVNASSSSVYGRPEYLPYDEDHPTLPQSPYAATKLASEHYCRLYHDLHGLSTVSLRYFTVYGPRMRPNMAISNFVSRCVNGDPPIIYGDGEQTRDFTHVSDVVDANVALADRDDADGEVLNIGSTGRIRIRRLADYVIDETGADVQRIHQDAQEADARHTHADVSKARALIDYEPTYDVRSGVSAFVDWYQYNRDWYENLVEKSA